MSTHPAQILELLQIKQADFTDFNHVMLESLQQYRHVLTRLRELDPNSCSSMIEPLTETIDGVIPCKLRWNSREESLQWVRDRLKGVATFAVDGSQIYPSKDISIPVALVQIGWFENCHEPNGNYEKDVHLDLLTPTDLRDAVEGNVADRKVNFRRFELESRRLVEYMEAHSGNPNCLVLWDGSLVATFAEAFDPEIQRFYAQCLLDLLKASETHQIPLVAYVDTSYATDLTHLLQQGFALPDVTTLHDAQLLNGGMNWGDRTPLFRCERKILQRFYQHHYDRIGFLYLKTHEGYPARLELPLWVYEAGRLEQIMDWVRGEVIIGSGYPYAIETADQVAVLQNDDRQLFFRILQDWTTQTGLKLRLSRKMVSKIRRRR